MSARSGLPGSAADRRYAAGSGGARRTSSNRHGGGRDAPAPIIESAHVAEPVLPHRLYKYRSPDLHKLRAILVENELWAATPTSFNDPFDCFPHIDLSGTREEAMAYFDLRMKRTGATVPRKRRLALARSIARSGLGVLGEEARGLTAWREAVSQFGVISFAAEPMSILMWSHYAQNHTGVCLEFDTSSHPFSLASKVGYDVERPTFRPLSPDRSNLMQRLLLRKADIWSYEEEWRYVRLNGGSGRTRFPASALTAVILGAAVEPKFEEQLSELIRGKGVAPALHRAEFDPTAYKLHLRRGDVDGA